MANLIHLSHTISMIWAAAGELITATAILGSLNILANAIRTTYKLGQLTGRIIWPVLHFIKDSLALIDWRVVFVVFVDATKTLIALIIMLCLEGHKQLIIASETLGKLYANMLTQTQQHGRTIAPVVNPLYDLASEMQDLTCKQLRQIVKAKTKDRKQALINHACLLV